MPQRKRILFGMKPDWENWLQLNADPQRFEITMGDLTQADTSGFDAIVPLTLPDHRWLENAGPDLPALPVSGYVRQLCDDKLMLNRRLIDHGFGDNIPRLHDVLPRDPVRHPVIIKARTGAWGQDCDLLLSGPVPGTFAAKLAAGTHFVQDFIPGGVECATHVLIHRGQPQFWLTREYDMGSLAAIKGAASKPVKGRWLPETPAQGIFQRMLAALGFDQGTCCIDYRLVGGRPLLFEVNPRFGGSLAGRVSPYLDSYMACLDRDKGQVRP